MGNNNYCNECKHIGYNKNGDGLCGHPLSIFYNKTVVCKNKCSVVLCPCKENRTFKYIERSDVNK